MLARGFRSKKENTFHFSFAISHLPFANSSLKRNTRLYGSSPQRGEMFIDKALDPIIRAPAERNVPTLAGSPTYVSLRWSEKIFRRLRVL